MFSLSKGKFTGKIVDKLKVDEVIISQAKYASDDENPGLHYHEVPHLCFVLSGDIGTYRPESKHQTSSDINFYHAGEVHSAVSHSMISTSFNIEFGDNFLDKFDFTESDIEDSLEDNLDAKFLVLKMQQEMLFNDNESFATIQTLLLDLINHSKNRYHGAKPEWVGVLYQLLNDRWDDRLTLPELAQFAEVHPVTISRYFRRYFRCTLGEYRRKLKIDKSISLVKKQDLSLTEIAFLCGFADQSHFTRSFKQFTGFLPNELRKL